MYKKNYSEDFFKCFNDNFRLTTVEVIYHMPDYYSVLQEFIWQTLDRPPEYPRIHTFLEYWEKNIEGKIHSVRISDRPFLNYSEIKTVDKYFKL